MAMKYLILFLLFSFGTNIDHSEDPATVEGSWCLVNKGKTLEIHYGQLKFSKNGDIILTSIADTVFRYKYEVIGSDLLIIRAANKDTVRSHILKLTTDSLILSSLIEKKQEQVYYRCNVKL